MTQINLTLEPELLKDLFMHDSADAVRKLVEKVVDAVLNAEMVIQGVSTRKVSAITQKLCGIQFSAQTLSTLWKQLDKEFQYIAIHK